MALAPRPPLTRETLASLALSAGLTLDDAELDALHPPTAAIFAALDRLHSLDLAAVEPASHSPWPPPTER
jgi:hypothetical protein